MQDWLVHYSPTMPAADTKVMWLVEFKDEAISHLCAYLHV